MADWIGQEPFDLFITVTAATRTHPEAMLKRSLFVIHLFNKFLWGNNYQRKGLRFEGVIAIERQRNGNPHSHTLLRQPPAAAGFSPPIVAFQQLASETGGFCKVEIPRNQEHIVRYCSKYIVKGGELFFTDRWAPVRVTMPGESENFILPSPRAIEKTVALD